ncbi:Anti-sigma-28 factor, FlgM [Sterolibacterium denitrificans]|uniref:Anti-sigma-28 factor, FlgM n=2 Tax=Sterolibacterium denitrificans TaxID=157592 RepID=A0A7Z7HSF4_9PROT|nr:flagellar biosynthesis anti-sigma factor FlgM [Sterolibacterium denitrificans]KYC29231.1 hypothetical protein ACY05_01385 [Sterolibacterium denitrificans]SMB29898.1 Anti-sigma-28 factor, FlgM [Sterolibacterium denitrificans]
MKIDSSIKSLGGLSGEARKDAAKPAGTASSPAAGQSTQSAEVALSPLSARLQELESAMATTPVADSQRVAAIREAIAAGTFQVDASKIADGLVDSVRQMLAAQK